MPTKLSQFVWSSKSAFASLALAMSCVAGCNQQDQQAQSLLRTALDQQKAGQTADAVKTLDRSLALDTDLAEAFYLRGSCQAALGNKADALKDLEKARELRPEWDRSWWALGTLYRSMNQNDKAITCLTQSVKLQPNALDARYDLACLLLKNGQTQEAKSHLDHCRQQHPDDVKTQLKCASIELDSAPEKAVSTLSHVLTLDRSNAIAWTQRAIAQERSEDIPRALADFTVACRLKPGSSQAWFHRGRLLSKLKRSEEALESLNTAIKLAPDDLQIQHQLQMVKNHLSGQAADSPTIVAELKPLETPSESPSTPQDSATEFLMFPEDLNSESGEAKAAEVSTADNDEANVASGFLPFPETEEEPAIEVAETASPSKDESTSLDFPPFEEFNTEAETDEPVATAMIPQEKQQTDGLQIPAEETAEVIAPAPQTATASLLEVPQTNESDNEFTFEEFAPIPQDSEELVVDHKPAPTMVDLPESDDVGIEAFESDADKSNSGDKDGSAAVVVIEDFNESPKPAYTLDQLDALYHQALVAYRDSDLETCEARLTLLLQEAPQHQEGRLRLAYLLEEKGQLQDARSHCQQLLADHGLSTKPVLLKAKIERALDEPDAALETYSQLIESDIPAPIAVSERADLLIELKKHDAAIQDLSELIDAEKMVVQSLRRRATAYEARQQWGLAIADWTHIGQIDGSDLAALESRADAFAQMGETQPAIADLQNLLRIQPKRIDVVQKLCDLNAALGRWDQVYALTSRAVQSESASDEMLFLKATAASELDRTGEAIASLSKALTINPDHQPARVRRAELLFHQENLKGSLADWNEAIQRHGESASLLAGRAATLNALGQRDQAIADLDQAISIEPNNRVAQKTKNQLFQTMDTVTEQTLEASELVELSPVKPQNLADTAIRLFEQDRFQDAADALDQAISSSPDNADLLWKRAQCRLNLNQKELAVQDLDRVLASNPLHESALRERAKLKEDAGSYASAVTDLTALLELNPQNPEALLQRGILNHRMARFDSAVDDLSKAIELQPSSHQARYRRGLALQQLNQTGAALADLEAAIKADPENADYLYSRGNLFASQSINKRAIEDYAQAVAIRPTHAAAWYNYGNMLFPSGKVEQAIECWNKAIEIQPDLFRAYNNRAAAYVQLKQYPKAIADYQRTLELNPEYAHAYDNYAWLLATADDSSVRNPQEAIALSRKACEITNNKDWAYLSTLAAAYAEAGDFDMAREWLVKSHELAPATQKDRLVRLVKTYESELQRGSARKSEKKPGVSIRL